MAQRGRQGRQNLTGTKPGRYIRLRAWLRTVLYHRCWSAGITTPAESNVQMLTMHLQRLSEQSPRQLQATISTMPACMGCCSTCITPQVCKAQLAIEPPVCSKLTLWPFTIQSLEAVIKSTMAQERQHPGLTCSSTT